VTELLALASAVAFGAGDFLGGRASRDVPPLRVAAIAQVASAIALVPLLLVVPAPAVTGVDLAWGAAGGLFGLLGIFALYAALGAGPMGLVAPTTAVLSAVVPVGFGLATSEAPGLLALVGIGLGLVAVVAITASDGPGGRLTPNVLALSLVAGLGFAVFFIALAQTSVDAGMWPLVGARGVSVPIVLAVIAVLRRRGGGTLPRAAIGAGVLDMVANGLFLAAVQRGLLAIAAVLAALYPAATALLARAVLDERMSPAQLGGVAIALVAVVMIGLP
jgi:drug/metabolite transporter (DMT)-like permease